MEETSVQNRPVRVRYAPSPTGVQHIGGLRTALYGYLFAKRHGGTFILRIEDTDQKRLVPGATESIIAFLEDFRLTCDEGPSLEAEGAMGEKGSKGPYIQSLRKDLYQKYADQLLADGHAYRCYCSPERLEQLRAEQTAQKQAPKYDKHCLHLSAAEQEEYRAAGTPSVIRLDIQNERGEIVFDDVVRDRVSFQAANLDDFVLMKSDGFPTYHLANVVDDYLMEISHVIRGEEWLSSTPKHILLYEAFGWEAPLFAHLPNILGADGKKKLSKRDGDVSVGSFLERGYLRAALINFVALLGWNPGKGATQEIFSLKELERVFDLSQVHKAGAVFDQKKLDWMNGEYIKQLSADDLWRELELAGVLEKPLIMQAPAEMQTAEYLKKVLTIERERMHTLVQFGETAPGLLIEELQYESELLVWKKATPEGAHIELERARALLESLDEKIWEKREDLETILLEAAGEKRGDFLWPLRVALSGAERSPTPFELAWVLGKARSIARLEKATARLS